MFAPTTPAAGKGRAVLFWIYGGGLRFGQGGHYVYDASKFAAEQDVIVVSFNYRTNGNYPNSSPLSLRQAKVD